MSDERTKLLEIHQLGIALRSTGKLNILLQEFASHCLGWFDADLIVIYEYQQELDEFKAEPIVAGSINDPNSIEIDEKSHQLVYKVVLEGDHYSEDVKNDPFMIPRQKGVDVSTRFAYREGIESAAAIRIELEADVAGVMFLNYRSYHQFTQSEKIAMKFAADYAALAYINSKERESLTQQLTLLTGEIFQIPAVTDFLSLSPDIEDEILRFTLDAILATQNERLGYYARYDELNNRICVSITSAAYRNLTGANWSADRGITGAAVRSGKSRSYPDVKETPEFIRFADGDVPDLNSVADEGVRSALTIPLVIDGHMDGVFLIESDLPNNFSTTDQRMIEMLVSQAALAIKNARYLKDIELGQRKLAEFRELDRLIVSTWDLERVCMQILGIAKNVLRGSVRRSNISLIMRGEEEYFLVHYTRTGDSGKDLAFPLSNVGDKKEFAVYSPLNLDDVDVRRPIKEGITRQVVLQNRSHCLTDTDDEWELFYQVEEGIRSELAVPLRVRGIPIGVLNLESTDHGAFGEEDVELTETLAGQAAIALVMTKMLNDIREIGTTSLQNDKETFSKLILRKANDMFGTDVAALWNFNRVKEELEFGHYVGSDTDLWADMYLDPRHSLVVDVLESGEATLTQVEDYMDEDYTESSANFQRLLDAGIRSIISTPFLAGDERFGVMNLYTYKTYTVTDWDDSWEKNLLELYSALITVSLQNFRRYSELQESVDASIFERLRTLINFATHEIYGSVGFIRVMLNRLTALGIQDAVVADALEKMRTAQEKALAVPRRLSDLIENLNTTKEEVSIYHIVDSLVRTIEVENVTIDYDDLREVPPVRGNADLLKVGVFSELIHNAIKAMPAGGNIRVSYEEMDSENLVRIVFADTGHGILLESPDDVFTHGKTLWSPGRFGTGTGLHHAKKIVEIDHRGRLTVGHTQRDEGTTFHIDLLRFLPMEVQS